MIFNHGTFSKCYIIALAKNIMLEYEQWNIYDMLLFNLYPLGIMDVLVHAGISWILNSFSPHTTVRSLIATSY